jgi:hypothetical protein
MGPYQTVTIQKRNVKNLLLNTGTFKILFCDQHRKINILIRNMYRVCPDPLQVWFKVMNKKHPYKKLFDVVARVVLLHTRHTVHNLSTIII